MASFLHWALAGYLDNLQKVKAVEHLVFLAQIAPLEVVASTDF
jgi:hypothetical protein